MKNYNFWWWNWNVSESEININNIEQNFVSMDYLMEEYLEYYDEDCTFDEYIESAQSDMGGILCNLYDIYNYFDEKRSNCGNLEDFDKYSVILGKIAHRLWRVEEV